MLTRARIDDIAKFAGPTLYGEMVMVNRTSLDALRSARTLRESLGLNGWRKDVLDSMGKSWLSKMAMMEELWTIEPIFAVLIEKDCITCFSSGIFNPQLPTFVKTMLSLDVEYKVFYLELDATDSSWYLRSDSSRTQVDLLSMLKFVKKVISDSETSPFCNCPTCRAETYGEDS
jgi:hypothetical protein